MYGDRPQDIYIDNTVIIEEQKAYRVIGEDDSITCGACLNSIPKKATRCEHCGVQLVDYVEEPSDIITLVKAVVGIVGGIFGFMAFISLFQTVFGGYGEGYYVAQFIVLLILSSPAYICYKIYNYLPENTEERYSTVHT